MRRNWKPATLTLDEFMKLAGDRGVRLWIVREQGETIITNGARKYMLPLLLSGNLPAYILESLCDYFSLPRLDFTLDPRDDDS